MRGWTTARDREEQMKFRPKGRERGKELRLGIVFVWLKGWEGKAESVMRIEHQDSIPGNTEEKGNFQKGRGYSSWKGSGIVSYCREAIIW